MQGRERLAELMRLTQQFLHTHPEQIPAADLEHWKDWLAELQARWRQLRLPFAAPPEAIEMHQSLVAMWDHVHGRLCLQHASASREVKRSIWGQVYLGEYKRAPVAIKRSRTELGQEITSLENPLEEVKVHGVITQRNSPFIVRQVDRFLTRQLEHTPNKPPVDLQIVWGILEFVGGGELFDIVAHLGKMNQSFPEERVRRYAYQILLAMRTIFDCGYVHLDISAENVLLSEDGLTAKVMDFGQARRYQAGHLYPGQRDKQPGKITYRAPEIAWAQDFDGRAADMWSFGVLLYVMLTSTAAYKYPHPSDPRFAQIWNGNVRRLFAECGLVDQPNSAVPQLSEMAVDLVRRLLVPANRRLSVDDALAHDWFAPERAAAAAEAQLAVAAAAAAAAAVVAPAVADNVVDQAMAGLVEEQQPQAAAPGSASAPGSSAP